MTPRRTPSDEQIRDAFGDVGDALQRALVLSSDRVQSVLEDAVLRGRMTRRDAEDLATNLVSLGREQAQELRTALARSVGDTVATAGDAVATAHEAVATAVPPLGKKSRRTKRTAASPVNGAHAHEPSASAARVATTSNVPGDPAAQTAKALVELTTTLTTSELRALRELEAAGKARATVIKAIDRKLER